MLFRTVLLSACAAFPAVAAEMQPHRTVLHLSPPELDEETKSIEGTLTRTVRETCAGWSVEEVVHTVTTFLNGQVITITIQDDNTEDNTALRFQFRQRYTYNNETTVTAGQAVRDRTSSPWRVSFTQIAPDTIPSRELPANMLFTMSYTRAMVQAFAAGQQMFSAPFYESGMLIPATSVFRQRPAQPTPDFPGLGGLRSWRAIQIIRDLNNTETPEEDEVMIGQQTAENGALVARWSDTDEGVRDWKLVEYTALPRDCATR